MNSCLYHGTVHHRRASPVEHAFSYRASMICLDLAELDEVFRDRWFWSAGAGSRAGSRGCSTSRLGGRLACARFLRSDHLGDPATPLDVHVRDLVEARTGRRPEGPIRLLTTLRQWGLAFNPLSLLYCLDPAGGELEAVVADVSNTPWGERHAYVLSPGTTGAGGAEGIQRHEHAKAFHVSPFMPMEMRYRWTLGAPRTEPGSPLAVRLENLSPRGERVFEATLALRREEITGRSLAGALIARPCVAASVLAGIYWQALRLWWKGAPVYAHAGPACGADGREPRADAERVRRSNEAGNVVAGPSLHSNHANTGLVGSQSRPTFSVHPTQPGGPR